MAERFVWRDLLHFGRAYWYLLGLCVLWYSVILAFRSTFSIKYFQHTHGLDLAAAGEMNSYVFLAAVFATPAFGWMCDRLQRYAPFLALGSLLLPIALALLALTATPERSDGLLSRMGRAQRWPESLPSGCAWGAQGAGWRACRRTRPHRELICRGCLNVARQRAVSSTAHPAPEHPRLPRSPCGRTGTQTAGSPFFWVLFFADAKTNSPGANLVDAVARRAKARMAFD